MYADLLYVYNPSIMIKKRKTKQSRDTKRARSNVAELVLKGDKTIMARVFSEALKSIEASTRMHDIIQDKEFSSWLLQDERVRYIAKAVLREQIFRFPHLVGPELAISIQDVQTQEDVAQRKYNLLVDMLHFCSDYFIPLRFEVRWYARYSDYHFLVIKRLHKRFFSTVHTPARISEKIIFSGPKWEQAMLRCNGDFYCFITLSGRTNIRIVNPEVLAVARASTPLPPDIFSIIFSYVV